MYWNADEGVFYKVKSPSAKAPLKKTQPGDWLYEHIIHNILFPETAYELIDIIIDVGEVKLILRQACVSSESLPTDQEVEQYLMERFGFALEDRYWYGNELLAVTDVSAMSDNVLKGDDGKLLFVDPLIRLKKPALEVIEALIGAPLT